MIVKLLTDHNSEFLGLKEGYRGSSESTHVKMLHCWKSHALAHIKYGTCALHTYHTYSFVNPTTTPFLHNMHLYFRLLNMAKYSNIEFILKVLIYKHIYV